jgi:hypothetical protein
MILRFARFLAFGEQVRVDGSSGVWTITDIKPGPVGRLTVDIQNRVSNELRLTLFLAPDDLVELVS